MNAVQPRCFLLHASDNVATVLGDAATGATVAVLGESAEKTVGAAQAIRAGHKIAVRAIAAGEPVIKYGCAIGEAISSVAAGEWVHLHNCRSRYDALSSELDVHSGARERTQYA